MPAIAVISCADRRANRKFTTLSNEFINEYLAFNPVQATLLGDHSYDDRMNAVNSAAINERTIALNTFSKRLSEIDSSLLTPENIIDYRILKNQIRYQYWELKDYRRWESDPTFYCHILKNAISGILRYEYYPVEIRCQNLIVRLKQIPGFLDDAKGYLKSSDLLAIERTQMHIASIKYLLNSEVIPLAHSSTIWRDSLVAHTNAVADSLARFNQFVKELAPISAAPEPVGKDIYMHILRDRYFITWTTEEVTARAEYDFQEYYRRFLVLIDDLYNQFNRGRWNPELTISEKIENVLSRIANRYTQDQLLIEAVQNVIAELYAFIEIKELTPLPADTLRKIERMPEWDDRRELSYLFHSGPLAERKDFVYYVRSLPANDNWIDQIAFLKKFNNTMLRISSMQQVIPGRLLLTSCFDRQSNRLRVVFPDPGYDEGWPFFAGFMMIEAGYQGFDTAIELMHVLTYLQTVTAALIDVKYHTQQLTIDEAMDMLINDVFLDSKMAKEIIDDIVLQPAQRIVPVWGFIHIRNLYQESQAIEKNYFSRIKFWNRLTGDGAIPMTILSKKIQLEIRTPQQN